MLKTIIPCHCGVPGCTIGPHYEVFKHTPQAFCYPAEDMYAPEDGVFRKSIHEAGHCVIAKATGALIERADIMSHEAHSGAAYIRFPEAMKADRTRWGLAEALTSLGGMAAELAILGDCDEARHTDGDLKLFAQAIARCNGQWNNPDLKEMLIYVLRDFLKSHKQALCYVARRLVREQYVKGSDVQSMLTAMGGVEPLLMGNWEQNLLTRMKALNTRMEDQLHFRAAHQRFLELSAQAG